MRILVIRTDRIGDVLLSTPVLSVLREQDAEGHIAVLVSPYAESAIEGHPALDEVIVDDRSGRHLGLTGFFRLVDELRERRFDAALVLHPTARLALACRLARIPVRIGSGYRAYGFLYSRRIYEHRKDGRRHEVEYNLSLARALFSQAGNAAPEIHVPDRARLAVAQRVRRWRVHPDDPLVVLHPGSGGSARNWPAGSFARLADRLAEGGVCVIVTGSDDERALAEQVAGSKPARGIPVAGELDIKELAALLQASSLCVTNSTGPLHIAAAVGTPTVALFCPIKTCSPTRWGPFGRDHDVFVPEVPACPRCIETACPYYDCMERISVDDVFEAVRVRLMASNEGIQDRPVERDSTLND